MTPESSRDVRIGTTGRSDGRVSQAELQQEVQRIVAVFMDRVSQAGDPLVDEARESKNKEDLLQRVLLYNSSALDIATGPFPEINLLDMLVFTHLCRNALERHWIPVRLGQSGEPLVAAFALAEQDLWDTADRIIDANKHADLEELLDTWEREHSEQYRVEGVRFREFSQHAGVVATDREQKTRGLLGQMRTATLAADQALLISERALFLAHRMPFLIRLQVRIGVQETMDDSLSRLDNVEALLQQVPELRPMLADLVKLASHGEAGAREGRLLVADLEPLLDRLLGTNGREPAGAGTGAGAGEVERVAGVVTVLDSANQLTDRSLTLLREARASIPADPDKTFTAIDRRIDTVARRWVVYALVVGFGWALFFWSGYFVVKRLL
jgi:hypothetical protein